MCGDGGSGEWEGVWGEDQPREHQVRDLCQLWRTGQPPF